MNNYNPADRMVLNGDVVTIDMDDTTAVLVVEETSTTGETQITSNVLFVDPNSSGTSEILTLPAEADWAYPGLVYVFNTGGEAIDVQNDAGTSVDIVPSEKMGIFTCDGTTWYGGVTSEPAYIDVQAFATGTAGVKLADNVANAWEILEDTNSYLKFITTTGAEEVRIGKELGWGAAHTVKAIETGTYQSTADGGIILTTTNARPVSFLFDDSGTEMAAGADIRATLSRVLLTVDSTKGVTINAMRGQIKALDGIDLSSASSVTAPVQGYLEFAGTGARTVAGHVAGVRSAIEEGASGTTTISASSFYSGFEATLNSTRTYTSTGKMAAYTANISGGTSKWPIGFYLPGTDVVVAGLLGTFAGSAATTGGVPFSTAQNIWSDGQASTFEIHGASDTNLTSAYCAKVIRARHIVNCTTAAHETYGIMGQCVVKDTTLSHLHAGVIGTFEAHTSGVVVNPAYTYGAAGVMARCGGGAAITGTKDLCGLAAFWNGAAMDSGSSVAVGVGDSGTTEWDVALGVERSTVLLALPAAGTNPVATGGTVGTHGTATLKIAIDIAGTTYYLLASTVPTFT